MAILYPNNSLSWQIPLESRYDQRHPGPDDIYWLIEVSNSTLSYDVGEKAQMYARNAIADYWVVDIPGRQLWVHRQPGSGDYQSVEKHAAGKIAPLAFPQLELDVNQLL